MMTPFHTPSFGLTCFKRETPLAPLAVIGYWLCQRQWLQCFEDDVTWQMQARRHAPHEKLQDAFVSILAGCDGLSQINTKLCPDRVLAHAWGRHQFADRSGVSRLLTSLTSQHVDQLRQIHHDWYRHYGQAVEHQADRNGLLRVEVDFTGLAGTPKGQGSCKGYFAGGKNQRGRQIARISIPRYHETVVSRLYPGDAQGRDHLKALLREWEQVWPWGAQMPRDILWCTDGGFGTDANINWVLSRQYQLLTKGYSGKRAAAVARQISQWIEVCPGQRWIAPMPHPVRYARKTQALVRRWRFDNGTYKHAIVICTCMNWTPRQVDANYDTRGQVEVEIKADKDGLGVAHRQTHAFAAQEALLLLTDMAHNLVTWLSTWLFPDTPVAHFGPKRIIRDLFSVPGRLTFEGNRLVHVAFWDQHPDGPLWAECFPRLFRRP